MFTRLILALPFLGAAYAQLAGTQQTETHPKMSIQKCTGTASSKNCQTLQTSVVLDSNWRWLHAKGGYTNCYTGNTWNSTVCKDNKSCAANCELEGVDYSKTYGITTSGNSLSLRFVTKHEFGTNVGSRVYLMETDTKYYMFKLLNQEFTFDVDVSQLPCGLNGALYHVSMDSDGGMGKYSTNKAGAKYGTGYCDAQCPHDMKFINGEANAEGWKPSSTDPNAGSGKYGTCCDEMDIWESNTMGTAYTPHPCTPVGQQRCSSASECGDNGSTRYQGLCDKDGCDFNSYRMGDTSFYGKGKTVDSTKKMTVVTQFLGSGSTLTEIRRIYIQNGKQIANSFTNIAGMDRQDSITTKFCDQSKSVFGDNPDFQKKGGMAKIGRSLASGMVLAMSIWDDHYANMLWLDSAYPLDQPEDKPGIKRGDCPRDSGKPEVVENESGGATVTYSNIKFGDIGTTF